MDNVKPPSVISIIIFVVVVLFLAWFFYRIISRSFAPKTTTGTTPISQANKATPTPKVTPSPTSAAPTTPTAQASVGLRELIVARYPDTASFFTKNAAYAEENTIISERPSEPNVAYLAFEKRLPGGILGEVQCFRLTNNQIVERVGQYLRTGKERKTALLPMTCGVK